jgi:hypothetical protein
MHGVAEDAPAVVAGVCASVNVAAIPTAKITAIKQRNFVFITFWICGTGSFVFCGKFLTPLYDWNCHLREGRPSICFRNHSILSHTIFKSAGSARLMEIKCLPVHFGLPPISTECHLTT